ncbi:MAG: 3-oxoacyl-ACP reductase FabG [Marinospirillum sp.]|uniref:3-ketoacyl-ACP reductase FabG2 n=1 Tax=Marinospirillum sp. TaxID=2183934 RepID=UPI0019F5A6E2|nr:3-ketoacyl-ACP reductase FabG2 [Marinospirillum sp.]MBE0506861.1 3-oxoacyl-ACP reductase FabG [Marinospirillum sp.]
MTKKRTVLVTGASKGIGRAIALRLAQDGFELVVHYHSDQQGGEQTLEQIHQAGGSGRLLSFDISSTSGCREALEADFETHGAYYGVVCNAGMAKDAAFPALTENEWNQVIHTNLDGFYNVLQPCVMPMLRLRQGGRIVTLSSVSGLAGNRGQVNYSAAKAGIIGATKALAIELAKRKVTVNCIAPGLIETEMLQMDEEVLSSILQSIPMNRMGQADEVASLASYLMSDAAGYITRQVISVNGGLM